MGAVDQLQLARMRTIPKRQQGYHIPQESSRICLNFQLLELIPESTSQAGRGAPDLGWRSDKTFP